MQDSQGVRAMLETWKVFLRKLKKLASIAYKRATPVVSSNLCSLEITAENVAIAFHPNGAKQLELIVVSRINESSLESTLHNLIQQNKLNDLAVSLVLSPNDYQLFLLDNPPVPKSEFQAAIRWKILELLPYSPTEAIIDAFPVPLQQSHNTRQMIMVVATQKNFLQAQVELISQAGLNVNSITIQELALRNVTALFEQDHKSSAIIYLQNNRSEIVITNNQQLYFQRYLALKLSELDLVLEESSIIKDHPQLNELALDIQRSFDYYQSQWRKAQPARIYLVITESKISTEIIFNYLSNMLAMEINILDLNKISMFNKNIPIDMQNKFLSVIGNALPVPDGVDDEEDQSNSTNNNLNKDKNKKEDNYAPAN